MERKQRKLKFLENTQKKKTTSSSTWFSFSTVTGYKQDVKQGKLFKITLDYFSEL